MHSDIEENVLAVWVGDDTREHLPGVCVGVILEKVVQASITSTDQRRERAKVRDFEFRTSSKGCASFLCNFNTLNDPLSIPFKVHCPLIQRTSNQTRGC
jgi:hypothetical protein